MYGRLVSTNRLGGALGVGLACALTTAASENEYRHERADHAVVRHDGILRDYTRAIARTVSMGRDVLADDLGFDMPDRISVTVERVGELPMLLCADGVESVHLRIRDSRDLEHPFRIGPHLVYSLCHELGQIAQCRLAGEGDRMTTTGAEGWAHFAGCLLVDELHKAAGRKLWPDQSDYARDGVSRLAGQLGGPSPSAIVQAAGLWQELVGLLQQRDGLAGVLRDVGQPQTDVDDQIESLRRSIRKRVKDPQALAAWWRRGEPLLFARASKATSKVETILPKRLSGSPLTLQHDSGTPRGRREFGDQGCAVRFRSPAGAWYLTGMNVLCSRIGSRRSSWQNATLWLLDGKDRVVARFAQPFNCARQGRPEWVRMTVTPTRVPAEFALCLRLEGTASDGTYVHYDVTGSGHSRTGLPGGTWTPLTRSEWMVRANVERAAAGDPLADPASWATATQPSTPDAPEATPKKRRPGRRVKITLEGEPDASSNDQQQPQ